MKISKTSITILVAICLLMFIGCRKKDHSPDIPIPIIEYLLNGDATEEIISNDGTMYGTTPTTNRYGEANSALYFDGIDDFINVPHTELLNFNIDESFSISIWVDPDHDQNNLNGDSNLIMIAHNDIGTIPYPFCIRYMNERAINNTNFSFSCMKNDGINTDPELKSDINSRDNDWNHIVFVKNQSTLHMCINNVLVDMIYDNTTRSQNNLDLKIGCKVTNHPVSDKFFAGKIDDIRFYDWALSEDEINLLFNE